MESDGLYYFNRCRRCNSLVTKLQVKKAFANDGKLCACGSSMFGPSNLLWYDWIKPSVIQMVVYQLLGKLDPPPVDGPTLPAADPASMQPVQPLSSEEILR